MKLAIGVLSTYEDVQEFDAGIFCAMQIIIAFGAIPFAWNLAGSIIMYYGYTAEYEVRNSHAIG